MKRIILQKIVELSDQEQRRLGEFCNNSLRKHIHKQAIEKLKLELGVQENENQRNQTM